MLSVLMSGQRSIRHKVNKYLRSPSHHFAILIDNAGRRFLHECSRVRRYDAEQDWSSIGYTRRHVQHMCVCRELAAVLRFTYAQEIPYPSDTQ